MLTVHFINEGSSDEWNMRRQDLERGLLQRTECQHSGDARVFSDGGNIEQQGDRHSPFVGMPRSLLCCGWCQANRLGISASSSGKILKTRRFLANRSSAGTFNLSPSPSLIAQAFHHLEGFGQSGILVRVVRGCETGVWMHQPFRGESIRDQ